MHLHLVKVVGWLHHPRFCSFKMATLLDRRLASLPRELLIDRILPYTYRPQNHALMADVRHFLESRSAIYRAQNLWSALLLEEEDPDFDPDFDGPVDHPREIMDNIVDMIIRHLNANKITNVHQRSFCGWRRMTEQTWMDTLETNPNEVQVNLCWGLLTVAERQRLIATYQAKVKWLTDRRSRTR